MQDSLTANRNVTEIFKTPGKLRGKTPRTARQRNPLEVREPLTDVFLTNAQRANTPSHKASPTRPGPTFQVAQDPIVPVEIEKETNANKDSGYHGLPEDDIDTDQGLALLPSSAKVHEMLEGSPPKSPLRGHQNVTFPSERHSTTERFFHSAKEELSKGDVITASPQKNDPPVEAVDDFTESTKAPSAEPPAPVRDQTPEDAMEIDILDKDLDEDLVVNESRSPSQGSSPARPLVRKSSLTFAALPAREPLTTKKSIGARTSRTSHLDQSKTRGSFLGRFPGGKSLGGSRQPEPDHEDEINDGMDVETEKPVLVREESDGDSKMAQLHNKSSTQRLHDRINMLGKSQPARPTKSISAATAMTGLSYPELPNSEPQTEMVQQQTSLLPSKTVTDQVNNDEDDDDWIQSPQVQPYSLNRPQLSKSTSADVMENIRGKQTIGGQDFVYSRNDEPATKPSSPLRHAHALGSRSSGQWLSRAATNSQSTSPAKAAEGAASTVHGTAALVLDRSTPTDQSTTPLGSPSSRRYVDGPLSASKSKLQSIMKTARGLFSSSAGVSAQARMETLSPLSKGAHRDTEGPSINNALGNKPPKGDLNKPVSDSNVRKTRSSTEKEERRKESEARECRRTEEGLERAREKEDPKAVTQKLVQPQDPPVEAAQPQTKPTRQSPRKIQIHEAPKAQPDAVEDDLPSHPMGPPVSHAPSQQSQLQKPSNVRRPIKPAKETAPKPKPQPVAIRVGTLSQRIPLSNAALSSSLQESLPQSQPKQPAVGRKPSNASLQTSASNSSLKSSATSTAPKPKALLAAERKKEQDEKEAQRKLDQKREIERKRAAQQEEARRQELQQRQEAERQREHERAAAAEDPKKIAQKQAIEKRRMELNKKEQQQRAPQRPAMDQAPVSQYAHGTSTIRPDMGAARPPSRLHNVPPHPSFPNTHAQNPAKPANKRVFNPDTDDEPPQHARPQGGPSYQQDDGKRRRTEDEELQEVRVRPTMAPPIRQSGIRKDGHKASIFSSNYTTAPPPAPHHHNAPSLLKTTTASQAYQQHAHQNQMTRPGYHPDIAKYTNGKIPFAEAPNPPQANYKTPLPSKLAPPPAKASPHYQNGENIHLDDIPTESEESDSEEEAEKAKKGANLPEWAQSPQLRQLLMTQDENMDADAVFGPVASPHMEEMFKERHHRFRSRTSSANWAGADRLTEEEIRRDVEARQRLRREGGWTFGL